MLSDQVMLKDRYQSIGASGDDRGTAMDFNLRELEIHTASSYMQDGFAILDVGCGTGYSLRQYAKKHAIRGVGIDYADKMVETARSKAAEEPGLLGSISFKQASVLELPFDDNTFDVITSARCLMALLDWQMQQQALTELQRVLKPNGVLVLMEGTLQGLERLNRVRRQFGINEIPAVDHERLITRKFDEAQLISFGLNLYDLVTIHRFGMYYFITRVLHPLLVAPNQPRNDAKINDIARQIAEVYPNFNDLGHLVAFVWKKRS